MKKNTFTKALLKKGEFAIYDFANIRLYAYKTNDFIGDEVFILEKNGQAVLIETPSFYDNIQELSEYLARIKINISGVLLAYHMSGATFLLPDVPIYSTTNAIQYGKSGGGFKLVTQFKKSFGHLFDDSIFNVTNIIDEGKHTIGEINFVITKTNEAFDIEIPEIKSIYTHMLSNGSHSIVENKADIEVIIGQLESYIAADYCLILSSHHAPEDLNDVKSKINYLKVLKGVADNCHTAQKFKDKMKAEYPRYVGENYLDMTANFLFP